MVGKLQQVVCRLNTGFSLLLLASDLIELIERLWHFEISFGREIFMLGFLG